MEQNPTAHTSPDLVPGTPATCPVCHQPVLSQYYFCPNCGAALKSPPLSTAPETQAWIYGLSLILPAFCFLFISKWPGMQYFRSADPKAKEIGQIAWAILIFSTIVTICVGVVWTRDYIQATEAGINQDLGNY